MRVTSGQLSPAADLLRAVFATALSAVVIMDESGAIRGWNPQAETMFGWRAEEVLGAQVGSTIVPSDLRQRHAEGLRQYLRTSKGPVLGQVLEMRAVRRDGEEFPVELRISDATNTPLGRVFVAFISDISQRSEAAARAAEQAERLRLLEKEKGDYLHLAFHELRGPLGVLRGYLSMLRDGEFGDTAVPAPVLAVLGTKVDEMGALLERMVETARLDEGQMHFKREDVELGELVRTVCERFTLRSLPGHTIQVRVSSPVVVEGDRLRLETVVRNLIENAVKYSPGGGEVSCSVTRHGDHGVIAVRDRGLGIAANDIERLFVRFGRIHTAETSAISGTGLGLYVSREIARAHQGDLEVESTPGEGSLFSVRLPAKGVPVS
ncbi:MAG: PAS domain-containing sensor histidine kinase [Candidatus Dormibacteria bacterium]